LFDAIKMTATTMKTISTAATTAVACLPGVASAPFTLM
jgi:hypothetical protein